MTRQERIKYGAKYLLHLQKNDPAYAGETSFFVPNEDILDKLYTENLVLCFSKEKYKLLSDLHQTLTHNRKVQLGAVGISHAKHEATVRFFKTITEKNAYLQAIEDIGINPIYYDPKVGIFLTEYKHN